MSTEIQNLLCSCSSGYNHGVSNRCVQQKDYYNEHDIIFRYDSDKDDKLLNSWKGLDDDSWDVISSLRQKFCQISKSEVESTSVNESLHSSNAYTNRQPYEYDYIVERASDLIDYTPESEFLKKIKRQCQYLQNRLPNIFSALNDCFPESNVHECQKCLTLKGRIQLNNNRSWKCCSQQSSFSDDIFYKNKKNGMKHYPIFQGSCSEREKSPPRLEECRRQSKHISRSKKPVRRKKIRKRKQSNSEKCESENNFEPSLKKPSENSCERCWRYASPARSPVNKPDQRFNPNFRKGHSTTDIGKGSGDLEACEEGEGDIRSEQQNASPDLELPCVRHTCDTSNRSPQTSSQVPPHICIKQKMESAVQMGNTCPKHRCSGGPPEPAYPPDDAFPQNKCPKHRASPQLPVNMPHSRNTCSKHMGASQQPEVSGVHQKHRCPVHNSESPQLRHSQQKCPHLKSPEPSHSQQRSSPVRCSQQRSPQPGTSREVRHSCSKYEEPPRGILCSSPEKKTKTQSCTSGSKEMPRTPIMDDLDVTEYRDICMKSRKQNLTPPPNPCGPCSESARRTCGACPSKSPRTCDDHGRPKMESIPEALGEEKQNGGDKNKSGENSNMMTSKDADSKSGNKTSLSGNKTSLSGNKTSLSGNKTSLSGNMTPKSEKKPAKPSKPSKPSKPAKSPKSSTTKDSKKGSKKGRKGESPKKSPDKNRLTSTDSDKAMGTCNKSSPFDKAHPIRPCQCPPRIPENEMSCGSQGKGGHTLCCHCNWGGTNQKPNNISQNLTSQSQGCSCSSTRRSEPPEPVNPVPKAGTMECPYRAYMNKYGDGRPQGACGSPSPPEGGRCWRENHTEISTQELLEYCPRKYFVFYMANNKDKKENDVQVLVEELAQGDPKNDKDSKTKDITEKIKKMNKVPSDSMALRFQKGVSEACNVPQSSRILYF